MSGFNVFSTNQDLDELFQPRIASDPSAQLVPYFTPSGQNLSERYLPYTSGTKAVTTGFNFFDTSGNIQDLNDYFSKILTLGWNALGRGAPNFVRAIYALDASNIYVGGSFTSVYDASGNSVAQTSYIAKWNANNSSWSPLGGGAQGTVFAIGALDASNIYVGGSFASVYDASGNNVANTSRIAKWNGSDWSPLGGGAQGTVSAIGALDASNIYVGGSFTSVYSFGTSSVAYTMRIAKWNGSDWSPLGGGAPSAVSAIGALDASNIYVGGGFTSVYSSGTVSVANTAYIAKWNGSDWSPLGGGAQGTVSAIYALNTSNIYVGGSFTSVYSSGTVSVANTRRIAKWNGSDWSALGGGAQGNVLAIYALNTSNIYVGGSFTSVYSSGTVSVANTRRIAKWNGSDWSALGGGAQGNVLAIYALNTSNIYVGGGFTSVYSSGTVSVANTVRIAKWDGSDWSPLGGGTQEAVLAIYALNTSNIYVGGSFTSVYSSGTVSVANTGRIAKWGYS